MVIRDGALTVIRGEGGKVTIKETDTLLAHTHPHGPEHFPRDVGYRPGERPLPETDLGQKTTPAPEAIIYTNGETRFYDDIGHMDGAPPSGHSPISPDGIIDGKRY